MNINNTYANLPANYIQTHIYRKSLRPVSNRMNSEQDGPQNLPKNKLLILSEICSKELEKLNSKKKLDYCEIGDMALHIQNNNMCTEDKTGWLIQRNEGNMSITLKYQNPKNYKRDIIRATLLQNSYSTVGPICSLHKIDSPAVLHNFVLQAADQTGANWYDTKTKSVCFWFSNPDNQNFITQTIALKFLCCTSCPIYENTPCPPENTMMLSISVENTNGDIISRKNIKVNPQSRIYNTRRTHSSPSILKTLLEEDHALNLISTHEDGKTTFKEKIPSNQVLESSLKLAIISSKKIGLSKTQLMQRFHTIIEKECK